MVDELVKHIYPNIKNKIKAKNRFRKQYVKLNNYLNTTETLMSSNKWDSIDFEKVPLKCQVQNIMAFGTKCPDSFNKYIENKIHKNDTSNFIDIVNKIINYNFDTELCATVEKQWNECISKFNIDLSEQILCVRLEELYKNT